MKTSATDARESLAALRVAHAAYMAAKNLLPEQLGDGAAEAASRIEADMAKIERELRKQIYG